jgi:hypothetical protein
LRDNRGSAVPLAIFSDFDCGPEGGLSFSQREADPAVLAAFVLELTDLEKTDLAGRARQTEPL